ncbi:MAG: hypothetical protein CMJ54_04465 [Planctomycetaceae bacterium]|nr:hypothetical protein [Planctomycetaceae bacterium]
MIGTKQMTSMILMSRSLRFRSISPIRDLAVACITLVVGASQLDAAPQRMSGQRIGGQRLGGQVGGNPAGQALGDPSGNVPDGQLGRDALGSGDALDNNLRVGSGGRNGYSPRAAAFSYQAIQARNLVVTNNVAGGRGFRSDPGFLGGVGYLAPRDFRGTLGGDANYGFERDSALGSLDFLMSDRRMDPYDAAKSGAFQYRRDFTAVPEVGSDFGARRLDDSQIRLDRVNSAMTSGSILTTAAAPEDAEIVRDAQGREFHQIHSSVEGIKVRGLSEGIPVDSIYERAMANSDRDAVSVRPFRSPWEDEDGNRIKPDEQLEGRVASGIARGNSYDSIVRRVEANYKGRADVNVDSSGELSLRDRRRQVQARITRPRIGTLEDARPSDSSGNFEGFTRPEGDPEAGIGPEFRRSATGLPLDEREEGEPPAASDGLGRAKEASEGEPESARKLRSPEELYDIYQHRTMVAGVDDGQLSERAMELVDQAGAYMAKGRYARATDRLKDALRYAPGNPLIEAALANAQIGFGAFFSAELTLGRLFRNHFEVAGAVFDGEDLIPNRTNLLLNAADIRDLIATRKREGSRASGGLGLVLAYIGWQVDDREMIKEGLETMKGSRREGLVEGLEVVWLASPPADEKKPTRSE